MGFVVPKLPSNHFCLSGSQRAGTNPSWHWTRGRRDTPWMFLFMLLNQFFFVGKSLRMFHWCGFYTPGALTLFIHTVHTQIFALCWESMDIRTKNSQPGVVVVLLEWWGMFGDTVLISFDTYNVSPCFNSIISGVICKQRDVGYWRHLLVFFFFFTYSLASFNSRISTSSWTTANI